MMKNIESKLVESRKYKPDDKFIASSNLSPTDLKKLNNLYKEDPDNFWSILGHKEIKWIKNFKSICTGDAPFYEWFRDGKLNVSENCIDRHINKNKNAIIHITEDNKKQIITYDNLYTLVNNFSYSLKNIGLKKGDRVIIYMPTIPESIIAMQSCARLGLIHSVVFAGFSSESLRNRINDCSAKVVITVDAFMRNGNIIQAKDIVDKAIEDENCPTIKKCIIYKNLGKKIDLKDNDLWWHEILPSESKIVDPEIMASEDPLFILYTSGSTGKPKGIVHSSAGYLLNCIITNKWVFDIKDDDIFWCTADIGWITGHSYVVYGPLATGSTILIYDGAPTFPKPDRFWDIIEKNNVSIFYTAPTAIRTLMKLGENLPDNYNLRSLRLLGTVGEPINPKAWIWYQVKIGNKKCPIVDTWWQTETGANIIAPIPGITHTTPGTCTKPLPGIEIGIVDEEGNDITEINQGGNLVIKNPWPSMLRGIWDDEERYIDTYWKKFNNRFYITGDTARKDENGNIWIMGRSDDVVNISGHRLGTMEIESAIVSHEYVAEAAVVSYKHEIKGEAIHAFVTLKNSFKNYNNTEFSIQLRDWVKEKIGSIAKPDRVSFSDSLPKTRSGKIMRRLLRNIARGEDISGDTSTLENENILVQLKNIL
ncbi:MAG: acetate--CoA ligase [Gammaproteobacteria bacterium]|nr:acetate--CoA ligase [Gammaproteobacteria bacterium]MBT4462971.1 acetate--CoA ligase [Gammaproteobacteria bacterium]MBT4654606.1 acetate--CoA ligase [Gammaproteobacteria bacterium]MBT5117083.1 acetate--CoA ligase [Gammaproteobacteria bacterium]MBT5761292.1 acetate--CoA ligase [Gammaproteobacteria bacterium]